MIQKALLTPLAGCGAQHESHGVVDNITVLRRLRPTHLVLLVDDSETMGYVLTRRLVIAPLSSNSLRSFAASAHVAGGGHGNVRMPVYDFEAA